ncbi:MAG TPA: site-specific integrase [Solirubrobacteraceae bacterium]|jgi:integrase
MARSQGQVVERRWRRGRGYALRFNAYGERQYLTLGMQSEGWTRKRAETELANVLADVRRGTWIPPNRNKRTRPEQGEGPNEPTFHEFASAWHADRKGEITTRGHEHEEWALRCHLLPYFANWRLSEIDIPAVDDYRRYKIKQGEQRAAAIATGKPTRGENGCVLKPLSPASINKAINVLHAILELAVEYGHITSNPAAGRRRRLKLPAQRGVHLDTAEQIQALLDAAGALDHDTRRPTRDRRVIIATLVLAGPRAHELCNLLWRDVDLANGRIHVGHSKTQAGLREIPLLPLLRDELAAHRASSYRSGPDDPVFPTGTGGHRDKDNLRNRILAPALIRADELLLEREQTPLPAGVTPHKLRHTFASILVALGWDPASVMAALGHADPRLTLRVYTHLMRRSNAERRTLAALVAGKEKGFEESVPAMIRLAG